MRKIIEKLNTRQEYIAIFVIGLSLSVVFNIIRLVSLQEMPLNFTNRHYLISILHYLILTTLIVHFLKMRKWDFNKLDWHFQHIDIPIAAVLYFVVVFTVNTAVRLFQELNVPSFNIPQFSVSINWFVILSYAIISSLFLETLFTNILYKALEDYNAWYFIVLSIILRQLVFGFSGLTAIIPITLIGLFYSTFYIKYRQIWPIYICSFIYTVLSLNSVNQ